MAAPAPAAAAAAGAVSHPPVNSSGVLGAGSVQQDFASAGGALVLHPRCGGAYGSGDGGFCCCCGCVSGLGSSSTLVVGDGGDGSDGCGGGGVKRGNRGGLAMRYAIGWGGVSTKRKHSQLQNR